MKGLNSIKKQKNAKKAIEKEVEKLLGTFDYTNYKIETFYEDKNDTYYVPKPVFALSCVDDDIRRWLFNDIDCHPNCTVMFIDQAYVKNLEMELFN